MTHHWAVPYIGKSHVKGATGPDEFDCWGFFRYVQKEHFQIELPVIIPEGYSLLGVAKAFRLSSERDNWEVVQIPEEGDGVLMGHRKHTCHIGLWVSANGGGVLHCIEHNGVVFQKLQNLKETGWGQFEFIRRKK